MVERWHRTLKAAIKCHTSTNWLEVLPSVMLGLRSVYKEDLKTTPAELVYGKTLCIPGEFLETGKQISTSEPGTFVEHLRLLMRNLRPIPASQHVSGSRQCFVSQELKTCEFVFVRNDSITPPLQSPYDGPFKVIERSEKLFKLHINGKVKVVSIDRVKPAYIGVEAGSE